MTPASRSSASVPFPKGSSFRTGQVFRGDSGEGDELLFQSHSKNDVSTVAHLRGLQRPNESTNLELGASYARGHNELAQIFITSLYGMMRPCAGNRYAGRSTTRLWHGASSSGASGISNHSSSGLSVCMPRANTSSSGAVSWVAATIGRIGRARLTLRTKAAR